MSVQEELARTTALIDRVERLERVVSSLPEQDARRQDLQSVIAELFAEASPVRAIVAAKVLDVSEKTVRAWHQENVLVAVREKPRLGLAVDRLHEVMHLVRDLRTAGQTTGLLEEVYRRLSDARWQDDPDLIESLDAMQRGEKIPARRSR